VFFDEIQEFGDILTWAKFLEERSDYDYVFSGSLLGVDLFGIRSWPVGFLDELTMFPLTFEEFARACGTATSVVDIARESIERRAAMAFENVTAFLNGHPVRLVV
jgi:predicted AAA+ superfamily ATPase